MNEINYFIVNPDHEILDQGLELVYTVHHFLRGTQFNHLKIEPAADQYTMSVPVTGATDQATPATGEMPVYQLKKITIDQDVYYLVCYQLNGVPEEDNDSEN